MIVYATAIFCQLTATFRVRPFTVWFQLSSKHTNIGSLIVWKTVQFGRWSPCEIPTSRSLGVNKMKQSVIRHLCLAKRSLYLSTHRHGQQPSVRDSRKVKHHCQAYQKCSKWSNLWCIFSALPSFLHNTFLLLSPSTIHPLFPLFTFVLSCTLFSTFYFFSL